MGQMYRHSFLHLCFRKSSLYPFHDPFAKCSKRLVGSDVRPSCSALKALSLLEMFRMLPSRWLLVLLLALELRPVGAADLTVSVRSRVEAFKGSGEWRSVSLEQSRSEEHTSELICDMWDKHWCRGATERV